MPGIVGIPKAVPLSTLMAGSQELFAPVLNKYRNSEKVFQDFYSNLTGTISVEFNNEKSGVKKKNLSLTLYTLLLLSLSLDFSILPLSLSFPGF